MKKHVFFKREARKLFNVLWIDWLSNVRWRIFLDFFLHNFHALFHARLNYLKSERERNEEEGENEHIKMSCWIIKNTRINFSSHRQHSFILFFVYKSHTISFSFKISRLPLGPFPLLCRKISQWTGKLRKKRKSALIINSHIYMRADN